MLVKGDRVFFCTNSAASLDYWTAAFQIIQSLGLIPLTYAGLRTAARDSNINREARDDLYKSKVWILFLAADKAVAITDHWALPEVNHKGDKVLLVYAVDTISRKELAQLALPVNVVSVKDAPQFSADLKQQLENLLGSK